MVEPDRSTSPEALKVLLEDGVDAYREFLAGDDTAESAAPEPVTEAGPGKANGRDGNGTSTQ